MSELNCNACRYRELDGDELPCRVCTYENDFFTPANDSGEGSLVVFGSSLKETDSDANPSDAHDYIDGVEADDADDYSNSGPMFPYAPRHVHCHFHYHF